MTLNLTTNFGKIDDLEKLIAEGFINRQKHPQHELFIYNYTAQTQYQSAWNSWTLNCRGLILNAKYEIVARPFQKFFNLEECDNLGIKIPIESFKVYEKMDGSLGILYWEDAKPAIATRGSFTSDQASYATKNILPKYQDFISNLDKNYTYLFEIIYPQNRIVLDYGSQEKLVLLGAIGTKNGDEKNIENINWPDKVKVYHEIKDINELYKHEKNNQEGFVIQFESGLRVKCKFAEYKRLHRLLTGLNKRDIWEMLKDGVALDGLLENVPDEFYNWVKKVKLEIETSYMDLLNEALEACLQDKLQELDRKNAAYIITQKHKRIAAIIYNILDNRDPKDMIYKFIRPEAQKPFVNEVDF